MKHLVATVLFSALALSATAQGILKDYYLHTFAGGTNAGSSSVNSKGIDVDIGSGYAVGIAAGKTVTDWLRLELEWSYRHSEVRDLVDPSGATFFYGKSFGYPPGISSSIRSNTRNFESDLSYSSIMVNAYYDHEINDKVSAFGGLGIGFSVAEATFYGENNLQAQLPGYNYSPYIVMPDDQRGVTFTWQLLLGAAYQVNENFSLTFAYKLFAPGEFEDVDNTFISSFDFGATYLF